VPVIIAVLLINNLILKPAREKKRLERLGQTQTQAATPAAVAPGSSAAAAKAPIKMPDPIRSPVYPKLSEKIETRFQLSKSYPYSSRERNIFLAEKDGIVAFIPQDEEAIEDTYAMPEISYHGFFSLGADKVAILKSADNLLLTKAGNMLKSSQLRLSSVFPDHVVITDVSEMQRTFEVALSETAGGKEK
jgi:hypothetical protein